jgi:hypothetical protein
MCVGGKCLAHARARPSAPSHAPEIAGGIIDRPYQRGCESRAHERRRGERNVTEQEREKKRLHERRERTHKPLYALIANKDSSGDRTRRGDERRQTDDRQPCSQTTPRAPRVTGWTDMLDGTSRPTNPENEPNGIHQELGRAA